MCRRSPNVECVRACMAEPLEPRTRIPSEAVALLWFRFASAARSGSVRHNRSNRSYFAGGDLQLLLQSPAAPATVTQRAEVLQPQRLWSLEGRRFLRGSCLMQICGLSYVHGTIWMLSQPPACILISSLIVFVYICMCAFA